MSLYVRVPVQYGLYSSFAGAFVYVAFGTSKVVPMGPSAIVALMTYNTIGGRGPACATLLCFTTGVVQALMSLAGLGAVVNFISVPVCSGFTSASAILVIASQVKDLIGVRGGGGGGGNILNTCRALVAHAADIGAGDTAMGLGCIAAVMLLKVSNGRENRRDTRPWLGGGPRSRMTFTNRAAHYFIQFVSPLVFRHWCSRPSPFLLPSNTVFRKKKRRYFQSIFELLYTTYFHLRSTH